MLSWSSQQSEIEVDLVVLHAAAGTSACRTPASCLRFATAAARLDDELAEMDEARQCARRRAGESAMIDAAAVAANFHMMTRLADGTGARYPEARLEAAASTIAIMGAADMVSRTLRAVDQARAGRIS